MSSSLALYPFNHCCKHAPSISACRNLLIVRRFSKFRSRLIATNSNSTRSFSQQLRMNDDQIPEWLPKYDDLPQPPQYLDEFDEQQDTKQQAETPNTDDKDVANIEAKDSEVVHVENIYDSALVLDELQNNSIYPSSIKHKFVASLKDVPSDVYQPMENKLPSTADDAANWPVPPWHSPDFIEPRRDEQQIVTQRLSKYPEMFVSANPETQENNALYRQEERQHLMTYEERVTEANIKQQKLMRQQEINDYLTKRKEPAKVRKMSLMEDDGFRLKVHVIAFIALCVVYLQYRIRPKLANKYGYQGKDVERNQRLAKLPIAYRKDGQVEHEDDLAHLTTASRSDREVQSAQ